MGRKEAASGVKVLLKGKWKMLANKIKKKITHEGAHKICYFEVLRSKVALGKSTQMERIGCLILLQLKNILLMNCFADRQFWIQTDRRLRCRRTLIISCRDVFCLKARWEPKPKKQMISQQWGQNHSVTSKPKQKNCFLKINFISSQNLIHSMKGKI